MQSNLEVEKQEKPLKACCACKPTRNLRDECFRNFGEEKCQDYVKAHNDCLVSMGFRVVQETSSNIEK